MPVENLWGTSWGSVNLPVSNGANMVDLSFNDLVADIEIDDDSPGTITWDVMQDTSVTDFADVEEITLDVRWYGSSVDWNATGVANLEIYDGSGWTVLATFGNLQTAVPTIIVTQQYDVLSILNSLVKIDACQVRFNVTLKKKLEFIYADEARLVVRSRNKVNVFDAVTVVEDVSLALTPLLASLFDDVAVLEDVTVYLDTLQMDVFDTASVAENLQLNLDVLNVDVLDPFHVLITEHVDVVDLIVEVGVVPEIVPVAEYAAAYPTELNVSVGDNITATDVLDFMTTSGGELPADVQSTSFFDGTYNWRARFDATNSRIVVEYALDPDNTWTENVNARVNDAETNDFTFRGSADGCFIGYRVGDEIKYRNFAGVPTTTFSWSAAVALWTHGTKSYKWVTFTQTTDYYFFAGAIEEDGDKKYAVVKRSTNPGDLTTWDAQVSIGDTSNELNTFMDLERAGDGTKAIALFCEGTALKFKKWDSGWDGSPTAVATIKAALYTPTPAQFEQMGEIDGEESHFVYIKSDGTCCERDYEWGVGLEEEIVLDANTDCEHPAAGFYYGSQYIAYVWAREFGPQNPGKIYYKIETLATSMFGDIIFLTDSYNGNRLKRMDFCKSDEAQSGFVTWSQEGSLYSKAIGLGVNESETVTIVEDLVVENPLLPLDVEETLTAVEDATLVLDELFVDLVDTVAVLEYVDVVDIVVEVFTVFETLTVVEDLAAAIGEDAPEILWGTTVVSSWPVTNKQNAEDMAFNDQVAVVQTDLSNGNVRWSAIQDTDEENDDFLVAASVVVRFRFDAAIASGYVELILNNGDGETVLETFNSGNYFTTLTSKAYDVSAQLDTRKRVNNAVVMLRGYALNSPDIELDEVQVLVYTRKPNVSDDVAVVENVSVLLPELYADTFDQILVTEVAAINDIIIEVGVVPDFVSVAEVFTAQVDHLHMTAFEDITVLDVIVPDMEVSVDVSDSLTVVENVSVVSDLSLDVFDEVGITEYVQRGPLRVSTSDSLSVTEDLQTIVAKGVDVGDLVIVDETVSVDVVLIFSVQDTVTVVEDVALYQPLDLEVSDELTVEEDPSVAVIDYFPDVSVFDSVGVADVALLNDLVIELGPAVDTVTALEDATLSIDELFLSVFDEITVTEYAVGHYRVDVADLVAAVEDVALLVVDYPDVVDVVTVVENVTLQTVDYPDVADAVTITEYVALDVVLVIDVAEDITVTEDVVFHDIIVELFAFDIVGVTEYATVHDIVVELSVFDAVAVVEALAVYIPDLNLAVDDTITVTEYATTFDPVIELFVSESVNTSDVVITEGGFNVGDDVGVGGAIIDWVMVDEHLALFIERLDIDVYDPVSIEEYVQMLDIIVELPLVYDTVSVVEASSVDLLIEQLMGDDITVQESLAVYYGIEALFVEDISVTEFPVIVPEFLDLYGIFFRATPRKRMFIVDKRQSGDFEEVEI